MTRFLFVLRAIRAKECFVEWRSRVITVYFSNALFHQTADVEPKKILGAFQHSLIGLDIIKNAKGKRYLCSIDIFSPLYFL